MCLFIELSILRGLSRRYCCVQIINSENKKEKNLIRGESWSAPAHADGILLERLSISLLTFLATGHPRSNIFH